MFVHPHGGTERTVRQALGAYADSVMRVRSYYESGKEQALAEVQEIGAALERDRRCR